LEKVTPAAAAAVTKADRELQLFAVGADEPVDELLDVAGLRQAPLGQLI